MLYDVVCTNPKCGHRESDVFCRHTEIGKLRCTACGHPVAQDYATKRVALGGAMITFSGIKQESVRHFNDPAERERYGALGGCIQDDWTVRFKDREEERKFTKRTAQIEQEDKDRWHADTEKAKRAGTAEA